MKLLKREMFNNVWSFYMILIVVKFEKYLFEILFN